jgi:hypothetical protein
MAAMSADDFEEANHVHFQFLQNGTHSVYRSVVLDQPAGAMSKAWILLDKQATVDVFYKKELLENIRRSDTHMDIHCNTGMTSMNLIGDLPGYLEVWYHLNGIANILSLARVKEKHRVTFDSNGQNQFEVHKYNGTTRYFKQSRRGLYYLETSTTSTVLVNTIADNKSRYTNRNYSHATRTRKIQNIVGRPKYKNIHPYYWK